MPCFIQIWSLTSELWAGSNFEQNVICDLDIWHKVTILESTILYEEQTHAKFYRNLICKKKKVLILNFDPRSRNKPPWYEEQP